MSAVATWAEMVRVEHAQSDRMRGARPGDHWTEYARQFQADPRRRGDALVARLRGYLRPDDALLDVGAGGGRLALPLALSCRSVVAVEPSSSMGAVLRETAAASGISVGVIEADWLAADVAPADVVLCSHVLYVIEDIEAFVRKLERHARRLALVVLFEAAPQSQTYGLWRRIHGEPRHPLPSLPHFRAALDEMGIAHRVDPLPDEPARGFDSREEAQEMLARRLYAAPGTGAAARLEAALADELELCADGIWRIRGSRPLQPRIVAWTPGP